VLTDSGAFSGGPIERKRHLDSLKGDRKKLERELRRTKAGVTEAVATLQEQLAAIDEQLKALNPGPESDKLMADKKALQQKLKEEEAKSK
jgi:DNA repair exonuclease SbcCD ATPase subunit